MKHRSRNNAKDQQNQKEYGDKLDTLFVISHNNRFELIKNDEDCKFTKLQQESITNWIGPVGKTVHRDKLSSERKERILKRAAEYQHIPVTAESSHSSVNSSLTNESLSDEFVAKPSVTAASNTGILNGAYALLETAISRSMLWMTCPHRMFEVHLTDAFGVCFDPSIGPEILLFKRFKEK